MKILAGRRDEVLRKKAEYDKRMDEYNSDMNQRRMKMREDEDALMEPLKKQLEKDLAQFSSLEFDVRVSRGWGLDSNGDEQDDYMTVYIRCNEHNKFEDTVALAWSYEVGLDKNGEVETESSSWSGLKGTTPEQIESLKQTVSALELLNEYDWENLIRTKFPKYSEYYHDAPERPERYDASYELDIATMEDVMEDGNKIIKVRGWSEDYPNREYWVKVKGQTEKQWRLGIVSDFLVSRVARAGELEEDTLRQTLNSLNEEISGDTWTVRAKKANVHPVDPLEILDLEDMVATLESYL